MPCEQFERDGGAGAVANDGRGGGVAAVLLDQGDGIVGVAVQTVGVVLRGGEGAAGEATACGRDARG